MGLFTDIYVPAKRTLTHMETRGLPLDLAVRDAARREARGRLQTATDELRQRTTEFHQRRKERIEGAINGLERDLATALDHGLRDGDGRGVEPCEKHGAYQGLTKRGKCEGCVRVFAGASAFRARVKFLRAAIRKGTVKLKQLGPTFDPGKAAHWRMLLFDPAIGCGLRATGRTKTRREPSIDSDAIEKLAKRHPDNPYLALRVDVASCITRLNGRLAVEPDSDGRVHFVYSLHRSPSRTSSGSDDQDDDKIRASPGNAQNIPDRDRIMYRAPRGWQFVQADYSQIEARVTATLAGERNMLQAWRDGKDIHSLNAVALAAALGVPCAYADADTVIMPYRVRGELRSFRYAAKAMTHGWNYGMEAKQTAEELGLPVNIATRLRDAYFAAWPALRRWQLEQIERAEAHRRLVNEFGRVLPIWDWVRGDDGRWHMADPNVALSFNPQSDVTCMGLTMLPILDKIAGKCNGELVHFGHDSFLSLLPENEVERYIRAARTALTCPWQQIPEVSGSGPFWCPVDFAVGQNWGSEHTHADICPSPCSKPENPDGLRKVR